MVYISPENLEKLAHLQYNHYMGPVTGEGITKPNNAVQEILSQAHQEVTTLGHMSPLTRLKTFAVLDTVDNRN